MSKSQKVDIILDDEEQSVKNTLATLRSRNESMELINNMLVASPNDKWYFYSISIPPNTPINIRGKTKSFIDASVSQQYHYFNNRILHYKFEYLPDAHIVIEHCQSGSIHFHVLVNIMNEFKHNVDMELCNLFHIKKSQRDVNLNGSPVEDYYRTIAYFFKMPTTIVGCTHIEELNRMITKKQYEVSKYFLYNIKKNI